MGGVCRALRFGFALVGCIEIIGAGVFAVDECHRAVGFEFVIAGRDGLIGVRTVGEVEIDRKVHRFADQGGDINITA